MVEYNIRFTDGTEDFYRHIKQLCDESFGLGYVNRAEFDQWLLNPGLFNIALIDGKFAGFSVMIPASAEEIAVHMGIEKSEALNITGNQLTLIYKCAAVCPAYRKNGVLTKLVEKLLINAKSLGYGSVFLSAWTYAGKTPVESSLKLLNFTRLDDLRHMLWYRYDNYSCVICKGRCVCDATIFYRKL